MKQLLRIFFRAPGTRPFVVLGCLLLASLLEGVGIASLVPLIGMITTDGAAQVSGTERFIRELFQRFGIELSIGPVVVFLVLALCGKALMTLAAMRYVGHAGAEVSTELRRRLIANLLALRWSYLITQPMGRIANAISNDAMRAGKAYLQAANFMSALVQTVIFIAVAIAVSFEFALLALVVGAVVTVALRSLIKRAKTSGWQQTIRTQQLLVFLTDTLHNLKPVKAMAREAEFVHLLAEKTDSLRKALRRQVVAEEALNNLQDVLLAVLLGTMFYVTVVIIKVPPAEVIVVGLIIARVATSISKLQRNYQKAVLFESAYTNVEHLINETSAQPEPRPGSRPALFNQGIDLAAVSFSHGSTEILTALDLRIDKGSLTVLTGASGSGKSTVVDLILGLQQPDSGRVLIDGVPLFELDLTAWRRLIGYVPQDLTLLHDSVRANVTLGDPEITESMVENALERAGCLDVVRNMPDGLDTVVGEMGAKLSGGQRQRIALARALVIEPQLLILDEVTSALDPATGQRIAAQIATLKGEVTVLSVTHRAEFVDIADRLYQIGGGKAFDLTGAVDSVYDHLPI